MISFFRSLEWLLACFLKPLFSVLAFGPNAGTKFQRLHGALILIFVTPALFSTPDYGLGCTVVVYDQPSVSQLTDACVAFEKQFNGLTFVQVISFKSSDNRQKSQWWVSEDGRVAKKEISFESQATDAKGKFYGRIDLRSITNSFAFGLTYPKFGRQKNRASQMTVEFLIEGFHANAQNAFSLAPDSQNIEDYIRESNGRVESDSRSAEAAFALVCEHPRVPDKRFVFDKNMRLVFVDFKSDSSDQFRNGLKNTPPMSLPPRMRGAKGTSEIGPISYQEFGDRWVVSEFREKTTAGSETMVRSVKFADYELLETDLSDTIEFEGIALPTQNPDRRVSSQGELAIRYEIKDGKIVKVLDSDALAAAAAARQRQGTYGMARWYAGMGLMLVLAICSFIWARGRYS